MQLLCAQVVLSGLMQTHNTIGAAAAAARGMLQIWCFLEPAGSLCEFIWRQYDANLSWKESQYIFIVEYVWKKSRVHVGFCAEIRIIIAQRSNLLLNGLIFYQIINAQVQQRQSISILKLSHRVIHLHCKGVLSKAQSVALRELEGMT